MCELGSNMCRITVFVYGFIAQARGCVVSELELLLNWPVVLIRCQSEL